MKKTKPKTYIVQHLFNAQRKKKGPMLVVMFVRQSGKNADFAARHQFVGDGLISVEEMEGLAKHYNDPDREGVSESDLDLFGMFSAYIHNELINSGHWG